MESRDLCQDLIMCFSQEVTEVSNVFCLLKMLFGFPLLERTEYCFDDMKYQLERNRHYYLQIQTFRYLEILFWSLEMLFRSLKTTFGENGIFFFNGMKYKMEGKFFYLQRQTKRCNFPNSRSLFTFLMKFFWLCNLDCDWWILERD